MQVIGWIATLTIGGGAVSLSSNKIQPCEFVGTIGAATLTSASAKWNQYDNQKRMEEIQQRYTEAYIQNLSDGELAKLCEEMDIIGNTVTQKYQNSL